MGNLTAKTSGEIASFMTPAKTNIKSLKVHFSPKQLGTGDPSPENVREIVGWDGVEVDRCGRNLLQNANGSLSYLHLKKGTTITISQSMDASVGYFRGYDINKTTNTPLVWINQKNNEKRRWSEYTLEDDIYYAVCWTGTGMKEAQITIDGSVDFEPYQGDTVSYQWKLPDEYQEVEYIESEINSSSHPYINTGIIPNKNMRIYLEGITGNDVNGAGFLFGSRTKPSSATTGRFWGITWQNQYRYGYINNSNSVIKPSLINEEFIFDFNYNSEHSILVNDTTVKPTNITNDEYILPIFLFGINNGGSIDTGQQRSFSVKKFIIYNDYNDIESIMSLVPCYRKSDNEIGMYDTVSQTFYTNQGTGTFLKGNDVDKTFYGGYVDLISGELVETNVTETFTSTKTDNTSYDAEDSVYFQLKSSYPFVSIYSSGAIVSTSGVGTAPRNGLCNSLKISYIDNWRGTQYINSLCSQYLLDGFSVRMSKDLFNLEDGYTGQEKQNAINEYLLANPIIVYYELKNHIIHQLTPTQLQSFVGQNNFWSNADYVEIEYDLIETIDIQKAKQKITLNQPQLKTISDKIVSFNTDMVAPMKNCKIYFKPIQLGSGDPSPTNVRDINGWTNIDSYVNGDKISVDWTSDAGTVYGGYLDLAKNEVVATYVIFEKKWNEYPNNYAMTDVNRRSILFPYKRRKIGAVRALCNIAPPAHDLQNKIHFYIAPENNYIYMFLPKDLDEETLVQVASRIEEPIHYSLSSLTSQQLLTIKSTNHIWSETNGQQIDVKYWSRKNLTPTSLTDYLENQTWIDSAYIGSSGKKTTGGTSASHFLTNQILLEAGTYVLSGFSYYVGTDNTNFRIHAYDSTGKWLRQIAYKQIGNLSPVDISFTLDTDTYVNVSIAMDFDGVLAKIN